MSLTTRLLLGIIALSLGFVSLCHAQVSPFGGIGTVQVFDNNGNICTNCVIYSYQAGTTTQLATFTDSTGSTQNPNPIPLGTGGRTVIWLTTGAFYKFAWCLQNDGPFCAPSDVLASVDQVPGGASSSGGGGGPNFIGIFISQNASPATSGILRLASSDQICWRNASGSTNLCISKDSNDLLSWVGGSVKFPEIASVCSRAATGIDLLWADNTAHRWLMANNGGTCNQIVASGVDINTSDQVTQVHFGATAIPFCSTAPTSSQLLQYSGTCVQGITAVPEQTYGWGGQSFNGNSGTCLSGTACPQTTFVNAHTLIRLTYFLTNIPNACGTNAVVGVYDFTSSSTLTTITVNQGSTGYVDSGALSIAITAGHHIGVGYTTAAAGCTLFPIVSFLTAVYQ